MELSVYTKIVYALLKAGANWDETHADINPTTAHLNPIRLMNPSQEILKILMAAGADLKETRLFEWDDSLQGFARKSIRNHLKHVHRGRNLTQQFLS